MLRALGRAWPLPPADWRGRTGQGDFRAIGVELLDLVVELAGLDPSHRVLDLGCGWGRLVEPLRRRLGPAGSYEGLDVVPEFVAWNRRWITPVDPRFRFLHADVRNEAYHPHGTPAAEYRFPYADAEFDRVIATSLFTHLEAGAARRYLEECARVLAPGGRLFATFFLLDDAVKARLAERRSTYRFGWPVPYGAVEDPLQPEFAIAFERWAFEAAIAQAGLRLVAPPWPGRWSGVAGPSYQDVAVAERRPG